MLEYIYLIVSCVLGIELFLRMKLMSHVSLVFKIMNRVTHIIVSSRISDHWKEKTVPIYAFIILKNSLLILGILFLIVLSFSFFMVLSETFLLLILSLKGVIFSIIISLAYIKLRVFLLNE